MSHELQIIAVILQTISSLSIAGGFVFAAIQFTSYRKAQHVENYTRLVEMQMHLREMRVKDPTLAAVYSHDVQGMDTDEDIRQYFFNLMQLSVFEIVWFAYNNGQLPEAYFKSWDKRMHDIAAEKSFQKMMGNPSMKILHDDFQQYVQNIMAKTPKATNT